MNALTWTRLREGLAACIAWPIDKPLPDLKGQQVTIDGRMYSCLDAQRLHRGPHHRRPVDRVAIIVKG